MQKLEFATACNVDTMREALLTFGQPNDLTFTPIGLILRFSEGIDSLRNLARSSDGDLTVDERAAALVCSTAQLGGLLFSIIASTFALFSLAFIPVFVAIGVCCCQMASATRRRRAATRGQSKKPKRSKGPAYESLKGSDDDSAPAAGKHGASGAGAPASESKSDSSYTQIVDGYVYESGKKRRKATKAEIKEVEDGKKQVEDVRQQIEKARREALRRSETSNRSRRPRPPPPPRRPGVPPPPPPDEPPPLEDAEGGGEEDGENEDEDGPPPSLQRGMGSSDLNGEDDEEVGDLGFGGGRNFREEAQEQARQQAQADYARERAEQEEPEFAPFLNTRLPTFQFRRV